MPCTTPPWIWPSTMSGLTTLPTSSTATYERIDTRPVSVSTSTAHRWVPCGNEKLAGSYTALPSRSGSTPGGRSCAAKTASAQSASVLPLSGVPRTRNFPSANSRSVTSHSSRCAAIGLVFSTTRWHACTTAAAPTATDRDPYVSQPCGAVRVSPCSTSTSSKATPSWSATIWLHEVSCPCPCGLVPVTTSTLPVGRTRTVAASQPPPAYRICPSTRDGAQPHASMYVDTPMPSWTWSPVPRRAACSLRSSSYGNSCSAVVVAAS